MFGLIVEGNDVDTAPRQMHNLGIDAQFNQALSAALDLAFVDRYFLDAANTGGRTDERGPGA